MATKILNVRTNHDDSFGIANRKTLIFDFKNDRHHALLLNVGDDRDVIADKLIDLAHQLQADLELD